MSDSYAESFEIEIEREKLCRYYRRIWTVFPCMPAVGLGAMFGMAWSMGGKNDRHFESVSEVIIAVVLGLGVGISIGLLIVGIIYLLFIARAAKKAANALQVTVEGPFFRIREGVSNIRDRKLHFRAIIDYGYFQDSMMRDCGIGGLMLTTIAGGQNSTIRIHGIKNALEVRDMLSEIDRQRENA